MFDRFSFPNITGDSADEKIAGIYNYLLQLKEELEFELSSISMDNLSTEIVNKFNEIGSDIEKSISDREDQVHQVVTNALTVSDVINSELFKTETQRIEDQIVDDVLESEEFKTEMDNSRDEFLAAMEKARKEMLEAISFNVNFSTGNLEYKISQGGTR